MVSTKQAFFLPADPMHVAMFLSNSAFCSQPRFDLLYYQAASTAIFAAHNMNGLDYVTSHSFVQAVRSCAQRSLSSGGHFRKAPLSLDLCIIKLVSFLFQPSQSTLLNLQIATFIMGCFSGFLRYDCACQIFANESGSTLLTWKYSWPKERTTNFAQAK